MIIEKQKCLHCESENIGKNGKTKTERQKFYYLNYNRYSTLNPSPKYTQECKKEIIQCYFERPIGGRY